MDNSEPIIPNEHSSFEKVLIMLFTLSVIGFFFFRTGLFRHIFDFIFYSTAISNLISKTIRFWNYINSKTQKLWLFSIGLVIIGSAISILINHWISLIPILAGLFLFTNSLTSLHKHLVDRNSSIID